MARPLEVEPQLTLEQRLAEFESGLLEISEETELTQKQIARTEVNISADSNFIEKDQEFDQQL